MFDIEIVRPNFETIKQHGPSLNNFLKLTQQAFNICHPEQIQSNTAKLGQCLDLISNYYGFNSFGALKYFLSDSNANILPVINTDQNVLNKLSQVYELESDHELIRAYLATIKAYVQYSNLPDSINISTDGHYFNSLLATRYLQIQPWNPVLEKLIKNPFYKLPDEDVYEYSHIDRLVRVNILNNLLPMAKIAVQENKLSFSVPFSTFFGGQISKSQFLNEIAEFFDGKAIGSGLIEAQGIQPLSIGNPMYEYMLGNGAKENNIYAFDDSDVVGSMLISFKIMPRLQSMLSSYDPVKPCAPIKADIDLIKPNKQNAIEYAIQQEKYDQNAAANILADLINNLPKLNSVLSLPKAAWHQAEPKDSQSQLAWRKYVIHYAESCIPIMISYANSIILNQRATLKRVYFDENGLLMFNFPKPIELKPSSEYSQTTATNYEFSLFVNFMMIVRHFSKLRLDAPEKVHFRLMVNYLKSVYPETLPDPQNSRAQVKEAVINYEPLFMGLDYETGKTSHFPINPNNHFIISGDASIQAPYYLFEKNLLENRLSNGLGMVFIDGSKNDNQLKIISDILAKHDRQDDLIIKADFDFDLEDTTHDNKVVYISLHSFQNREVARKGSIQLLDQAKYFVLHNTTKNAVLSIVTYNTTEFVLNSLWIDLHSFSRSSNNHLNIYHFCKDIRDLPNPLIANTQTMIFFKMDDDIMRKQFSNFHKEPELLEHLPFMFGHDFILLNRSHVSRHKYLPQYLIDKLQS